MKTKQALITGAAGGMGYACSVVLAQEYEILLVDLDSNALEEAAKRL